MHQKNDLKYMERACTSYFFLGEKEKAQQVADKILSEKQYNARAWVVKIADEKDISFEEKVPIAVRSSKTFKNILATAYVKQNRHREITRFLTSELPNGHALGPLEYDDLPYWVFLCSFLYNQELAECPNDMFNRKDEHAGQSERIKNVLILSRHILDLVEGTELYRENDFYRQAYYIYNHSHYLINGDRESVLSMYNQYGQEEKNQNNVRIFAQILISLLQVKEYEKVIALCNDNKHFNFTFNQVLAYTYLSLTEFKTSGAYFLEYFAELKDVDEPAMSNLIVGIAVLNQKCEKNAIILFDDHLEKKTYSKRIFKNIIQATCMHYHFTDVNKGDITSLLNFETHEFDSLSQGLKDHVCKILTSISEYSKSNEYLSTYLDYEKETQSLYLYIKNLYNLKSDHKNLLSLLEKWRKKFSPIYEFFAYEMNLLSQLNTYSKIQEVAQEALVHYPKDPMLLTNLIRSLDRQNKDEELKRWLDENLLTVPFHWEHAFLIASICFRKDLFELGLELIFPYAKNNPDNSTIRQAYFGILSIHTNKHKFAEYETVENDTTVRVIYNGAPRLVHVNEVTIETNKVAKAILGKKKGENVRLRESLISEQDSVVIKEILDKYRGLAAEVIEEVSSNYKLSGYEMVSITWDSNDIKELNEKFIQAFGANGELRKLTIEDAYHSYRDGKISFTDLVRKVDCTQLFEIYESLTKNSSRGFIIPPLKTFDGRDLGKTKEFVVDISILPILSKWKALSASREYKFIVSQHLTDFVKDKINEISLLNDNPLSIDISLSGVKPIFYPPNYKQAFINELQEMLSWIDSNCTVAFAPEKLDLLLKHPEFIERDDWHFKYIIDTAFLANKPERALITDDLFFYRNLSHLVKPLTLEYFIKTKEPNGIQHFTNLFLKSHYLGLTLRLDDLKHIFDETPISDGHGAFNQCIKNFPFGWHRDESLIFRVIELSKHIYITISNLEYKLRLIEGLFVESLKGYPVTPATGKILQQKIRDEFYLLGQAEMQVLLVLTNALKILNAA